MPNTVHAVAMNAVNHPVFARLTALQHSAFDRHTVLHELDRRVEVCPRALAQKVHAFVERGVPYFAPTDRAYRAWAAEAARLWDSVESQRAQPSAA